MYFFYYILLILGICALTCSKSKLTVNGMHMIYCSNLIHFGDSESTFNIIPETIKHTDEFCVSNRPQCSDFFKHI